MAFSLEHTWKELRRRKVVRAGVGYAVVAWVVLQLAEITFAPLGLPDWALTWTVLGVVLGFPVVLVLAWFFDVSRQGVQRERGKAGAAGPVFGVATVLLTVAGLAWWLTDVYTPRDAATRGTPRAAADTAPSAPINSIAVLPFADMSPQHDLGHLADGLAEQLLDTLARSGDLQVAARTSSFAHRATQSDIRTIAQALGVRWVVEGSVRQAGDQLRVTAQLIDAANGYHLWSETYDRTSTDVFRLQDEIAQAVGEALQARIGEASVRAGQSAGSDNATALLAYEQARAAWRTRTVPALAAAERGFDEAVRLDATFARAWAGLADTYLLQALHGALPLDEAIRRAETVAVKAVTLGPRIGECWATIGHLRMRAGQLGAARRSLEQALRHDTEYAPARLWLAEVFERQGEYGLQRETLEAAIAQDPLDASVVAALATALLRAGEITPARDQLLTVLAITPNNAALLRALAEVELRDGRAAEALRVLGQAAAAEPDAPLTLIAQARTLLLLEDFESARRVVAALPADSRERLLLEQEAELAAGGSQLQPALRDWLDALPEAAETDADRQALWLAGFAALRADAAAEAIAPLQRAAGDIDGLAEEPARLVPATLLLEALRRADRDTEADALQAQLATVLPAWAERAGARPEAAYLGAIHAAQSGRDTEALAALDTALSHGFRQRWLLRFDPRLRALTAHPRVQALAQRLDAEFAPLRATP